MNAETSNTKRQSAAGNRHWLRWAALGAAAILLLLVAVPWIAYRFTHSITNDAFIESHLINLAPQVSGTVVEVFVQEQDLVKQGQLLARVDPLSYQREVQLARARLVVAEAALAKARVDLTLLSEEVPQRVIAAEKKRAAAGSRVSEAAAALALVQRDTRDGVSAAQGAVEAVQAALVLAQEDFTRYEALFKDGSVPERKFQEATRTLRAAEAEVSVSEARLGQAEAQRKQVAISTEALAAARHLDEEAAAGVELAKLGSVAITAKQRDVAERESAVAAARSALEVAETNLEYTRITAPYDGVIARKWRHLGDYAHTGDPVFSMYNPELKYVTVQLEETLLEGVAPGNRATLHVEAYSEPFRGRVLWIGSATSGNFSLLPRDISSGEFTYVVQRVPTRIAIERDDRWDLLRPGMSVRVAIEHGAGDRQWASEALAREARIEKLSSPNARGDDPGAKSR